MEGNVSEVRRCLDDPCFNVNIRNEAEMTALHLASLEGHTKIVKLLLEHGGDHQAVDIISSTPLHAACSGGHFEVVRLLVHAGASFDAQDEDGWTALHFAASKGFRKIVDVLLEAGADVNIKDHEGTSALKVLIQGTPNILKDTFDRGVVMNLPQLCPNPTADLIRDDKRMLKLDLRNLFLSRKHRESVGPTEADIFVNIIKGRQSWLLLHPLCQTFLFLKWKKVRYFFYAFVAFYVLFVLLLTVFCLAMVCPGMELVQHTLCYFLVVFIVILLLKDVGRLFQANKNPIMWLPRCRRGSSLTYDKKIQNLTREKSVSDDPAPELLEDKSVSFSDRSQSLWNRLKKTIIGVERWVQKMVLVLATIMVFVPSEILGSARLHLASIAVLLAWMELMFLMGRFPSQGIHVEMFMAVLQNFVKFLIAYGFLIVAFALSFCILFHDQITFRTPWESLISTLVMMTGEYEYQAGLFFHEGERVVKYPGTAHVIFVLFILLLSIVVVNLLVGLAVDDIQELRRKARLKRLILQTRLIEDVEQFVFTNRLLLPLKSWGSFQKWTKRMLVFPSTTVSSQNRSEGEEVFDFIVGILMPPAKGNHPVRDFAEGQWCIYLQPNDPRENRLPWDIVDSAYKIAKKQLRKGAICNGRILKRTFSRPKLERFDSRDLDWSDIEEEDEELNPATNRAASPTSRSREAEIEELRKQVSELQHLSRKEVSTPHLPEPMTVSSLAKELTVLKSTIDTLLSRISEDKTLTHSSPPRSCSL
ncbi:unnamed protein product [Cyprideis torosa]|uniref:Ion transport domain-containing protein n=1 Tax=Cyprideis torosa TaxID=163714 RepID=A0A7R8WS46_9CRUS|nr:unnamed protein product [Cyprideis torosa]CAG0903348.1 unnamed protein product [Cyprideis torosa]